MQQTNQEKRNIDDDDDRRSSNTVPTFQSLVVYLIQLVRRNWKIVLSSSAALLVLYLIRKQHLRYGEEGPSLSTSLSNTIFAQQSMDPRWKIFHSHVDKKNAHGLLRVRSKTHFGRAAGLMRFSEDSSPMIPSLGSQAASYMNNATRRDPSQNFIYYIDHFKRILSLLVYRIPRAIREWEIWLAAASYGVYYLLYYGNVNADEADMLSKKREKLSFKELSNRRIVNKNVTNVKVSDELARSLQRQFDKIMSRPVFGLTEDENDEQQRQPQQMNDASYYNEY